jgi:hypothetical protein
LAEAFQRIESTCGVAITDSLNVMSGAVRSPTFIQDQLDRTDFLIGQLEYLRTRRAELAELQEEAAMEGGE